jgi:hypothetical protein
MMQYPDTMTLKEARARFFERERLGPDGGYGARWVRVETRPVPVYFPNTACRVEAARLHDLHHVAMEYATDWPGEAEISAWEIAGGCGRHGWAWLLDLGAFTVGLVLAPRRVWRAFLRGRRSANLYRGGFSEERLSAVTVGELRRRLRADTPLPPPRPSDAAAFAAWALGGILWHSALALGALAAAWWAARAVGLA